MIDTIQTEIEKGKKKGVARVKATGEVFTPMDLCMRMVREIPEEKLRDPSAKFIDHSCGDGNFLVALCEVLTKEYDHPLEHVLDEMIYGVDLMPDNIVEAKRRLGVPEDHPHFVCADALEYDYLFE